MIDSETTSSNGTPVSAHSSSTLLQLRRSRSCHDCGSQEGRDDGDAELHDDDFGEDFDIETIVVCKKQEKNECKYEDNKGNVVISS